MSLFAKNKQQFTLFGIKFAVTTRSGEIARKKGG